MTISRERRLNIRAVLKSKLVATKVNEKIAVVVYGLRRMADKVREVID